MEQKEQICYCRQYLGRLESMQKDVMSESKEGVFLRKAASTRGGGYGQQVLTSLANKTRSGGNDDDGRSAVMCSTITFPPPGARAYVTKLPLAALLLSPQVFYMAACKRYYFFTLSVCYRVLPKRMAGKINKEFFDINVHYSIYILHLL